MSSPFSYSHYDRQPPSRRNRLRNRSTIGYWLPLALTVTALTVGVGTWIWQQRSDANERDAYGAGGKSTEERAERTRRWDERERRCRKSRSISETREQDTEEGSEHSDDSQESDDVAARRSVIQITDYDQHDSNDHHTSTDIPAAQPNNGLMSRFADTIRRTPSPLQVFERVTGRTFGFGERERWQEEVERREAFDGVGSGMPGAGLGALGGLQGINEASREVERGVRLNGKTRQEQARPGRRRVVAVVVNVSAKANDEEEVKSGPAYKLLEHIQPLDNSTSQLLVLVYMPQLTVHPLSPSFDQQDDPLFSRITSLASSLLQHPSHLLPFTASDSHVNLLKHIAPDVVYLEDTLASEEVLSKIKSRVGHIIVVQNSAQSMNYPGAEVVEIEDFENDWRRRVNS